MKCENCGEEHDGSYGSGRFCSAHCRRVWSGKKSNITMKLHGTKKCNFIGHCSQPAPYGTWKCEYCDDHPIFETRRKLQAHKKKFHPIPKGSSWNKGLTKEIDARIKKAGETYSRRIKNGEIAGSFKGKHHTEESKKKMSEIAKNGFAQGIRKGWKSRTIISFPENFWRMVLDNNNISYSINFPISRKSLGDNSSKSYFLDFKISNNIDLEIDGAQHRFRKEHDAKRDKLLISNGYKVYRIEWNEVKSDFGKKQMKEKIEQFLIWLKENMHD